MNKAPVELRIGGHSYRIATSAPEDTLLRSAQLVERRLQELPTSQRQHPNALLLVALSLAHDLEQERTSRSVERSTQAQRARALLRRVDAALGSVDEDGVDLPRV